MEKGRVTGIVEVTRKEGGGLRGEQPKPKKKGSKNTAQGEPSISPALAAVFSYTPPDKRS